ncbi:MAG: TRAP transporter small permease, partial [Rhodocyclaceae bacterium]|nr:TRAP transporter small permease [Rhodocyclaceae bacterium]
RALDLWSHFAGTALAGALAWFSARLVWQSWSFGDISQGTDATPLWIPQLAMAVGAAVLLVAMIDDFLGLLSGRRLRAAKEEPVRSE